MGQSKEVLLKRPPSVVSDALRVAGSTRIEPGSTLTPLLSTGSTRLVSPRTCMPQSPREPYPRGLLLYAMLSPATAVASPPTTSSCASAVPVRPSHAPDGRSFLPTSPAPPSESLCAPAADCAICDLAVASGEAAGTAHGGSDTMPVVAACADDRRQRLLLWRACPHATRRCGWGGWSWEARVSRANGFARPPLTVLSSTWQLRQGRPRVPLTAAATRCRSSPHAPTTDDSVCYCGERVRTPHDDADLGGGPGRRGFRERVAVCARR